MNNRVYTVSVQEQKKEFVKEDHYHLDLTRLSHNKYLKDKIFKLGVWIKNKLIDKKVLTPVYGWHQVSLQRGLRLTYPTLER